MECKVGVYIEIVERHGDGHSMVTHDPFWNMDRETYLSYMVNMQEEHNIKHA